MLKIRLARVGKKKRPSYRFVVSDSTKDTYGKALEIVGHYNPFSKVIEVNKERILYWISKGAQPSPTAHNLLVDQNVITGDKVKASKTGKKKGAEAEAKPETAKEEKKEETKVEPVSPQKPAEDPKVEEKPKEEQPKQESVPEKTVEEPKVEEKPAEEKK
jgi:small subunit ribosomal protein S16